MYSVKSRSGRRGTVLTNYAHDMTRLMLRAPISWFSSGPVSNVKMGRNVRQVSTWLGEALKQVRRARSVHDGSYRAARLLFTTKPGIPRQDGRLSSYNT